MTTLTAEDRRDLAVGLRKFTQAAVIVEQDRQIAKWGAQDNPDMEWLVILAEEFGEVARAILERDPAGLTRELIQVAAVAESWLAYRL